MTKHFYFWNFIGQFLWRDLWCPLRLIELLVTLLHNLINRLIFYVILQYETHRAKEDESLRQNPPKYPSDLFYMKQTVHNACGTVALVHSVLNNLDAIKLNDGVLKSYYEKAKDLTPEERGKLLEADEAFTTSHQELAQEGQTAADPNEEVNHHFISLVNKNGILYELDGRKSFPIEHGSTTADSLLKDAANVCKEFMARDPTEIRFTILALVPNQ